LTIPLEDFSGGLYLPLGISNAPQRLLGRASFLHRLTTMAVEQFLGALAQHSEHISNPKNRIDAEERVWRRLIEEADQQERNNMPTG